MKEVIFGIVMAIIACSGWAYALYINDSWFKYSMAITESWYNLCTKLNGDWGDCCIELAKKIDELTAANQGRNPDDE